MILFRKHLFSNSFIEFLFLILVLHNLSKSQLQVGSITSGSNHDATAFSLHNSLKTLTSRTKTHTQPEDRPGERAELSMQTTMNLPHKRPDTC